jgi:hypothetical protein
VILGVNQSSSWREMVVSFAFGCLDLDIRSNTVVKFKCCDVIWGDMFGCRLCFNGEGRDELVLGVRSGGIVKDEGLEEGDEYNVLSS